MVTPQIPHLLCNKLAIIVSTFCISEVICILFHKVISFISCQKEVPGLRMRGKWIERGEITYFSFSRRQTR